MADDEEVILTWQKHIVPGMITQVQFKVPESPAKARQVAQRIGEKVAEEITLHQQRLFPTEEEFEAAEVIAKRKAQWKLWE